MIDGDSGSTASLLRWVMSGGMWLTGDSAGPPSAAPAPVAAVMAESACRLAEASRSWGCEVRVDGPALLGERAALHGLARGGPVSVGGSARFVQAADGWVVLNLPRPEDVACIPALVERHIEPSDWDSAARVIASSRASVIVDRGALLGMAVARVGEQPGVPFASEFCDGGARVPVARPLVVDMSGLWAGPLLTSLLSGAGARVVKVEARGRPDGTRRGHGGFFDLLNHGKEFVSVDLGRREDLGFLRTLIAAADLVVESSRPRAMENLGIIAESWVMAGVNWISITGHGRAETTAMRVGFGDDSAVAGGLWIQGSPPMFVADAVADPMTGLVGAALAAEMLGSGQASGVDLALDGAAAEAAPTGGFPAPGVRVQESGSDWWVELDGERVEVARPTSRLPSGRAAACGAHDLAVRREFQASR